MASKIDPSTKHPEYQKMCGLVHSIYDTFYGRVRNERHVSRLKGQTDEEYECYVKRAPYVNFTERTIQQMIGVMTRNPFELSGANPEEIAVDDSNNLEAFIQDIVMDVGMSGRVLLGIDIETDGTPKLCYYPFENVINWGDDFIVIETIECERDPENPFATIEVPIWKELFLLENETETEVEAPAVFCSREWRKVGKTFEPGKVEVFTINGETIDFIPFTWITPYDNTEIVYNPPMATIAGLNSAHFRLSCDHFHGLHYLAVPTFTIAGELYRDQNGNVDGDIVLGSTKKALHLEKGASASFVEFSGSGLGAILEEKHKLEEQMNALGVQLVSPTGIETAQAANIRSNSQTSSLETMTNSIEAALNAALYLYGQVIGREISIKLNNEFVLLK